MNAHHSALCILLLNISSLFSMQNLLQELKKLETNLVTLNKHILLIKPVSMDNFRLPSLTETQQAAGVQNSQFYKLNLDYNKLHQQGHATDAEFLKEFFFDSMFQYYIHEFLNLDLNYNYQQWKIYQQQLKQYDLSKFTSLANRLHLKISNLLDPKNPVLNLLNNAVDNFKRNQLLQQLGTAFQRTKIILEKLRRVMDNISEESEEKTIATKENFAKTILYPLNTLNTDIQTMIFNVIKEGSEQLIQNLQNPSPDNISQAADFLIQFKPAWIKVPYYQNIVNNLAVQAQPRLEVEFMGKKIKLS